jgi:hypothetical protein
MTVDELTEWFLDRVDSPPLHLHVRGVWADEEGGSHLGTPAWNAAFSRWIYGTPSATTVVETEVPCFHLEGRPCRSCAVMQSDGSLWETGVIRKGELRYRWPMRLTLHRLSRFPVRPGRPPLHTTLLTVQLMDGDLGRSASALSLYWPLMANPTFAVGFLHYALRRAYRIYDEHPDPLARRPWGLPSMQRARKSDAQLDAEAAGRVDSAEQLPPIQGLVAAAGT